MASRPTLIRPFALCLLASFLTLSTAAGCRGLTQGREVRIAGLQPKEALPTHVPLEVDIQNNLGSVSVEIDDRLKTPQVRAWSPGFRETKGLPPWIAATIEGVRPDDTLERIRLLVLCDPAQSGSVPTDLRLRIPSCSKLTIRTNDGIIRVRGVSGTIDIENGVASGQGGQVHVFTASPMSGPVTIHTSQGDVNLVVGKGSTGSVTARATDGVFVECPSVRLSGISGGRNQWTGEIGPGGGPFDLRTDKGVVSLRVQSN